MELIEYLRFLYKYWVWLVIGTALGVGLAGGYTYYAKDAYKASMSLLVQRQPDGESTQYYTYDGYYAQQTAAAFTDNALKLLTNDSIITRAAREAGLDTNENNISHLKSTISAKKDASQLIQLSVIMPEHNDAAAFTSGLALALRDRTSELNKESGDEKLSVNAVNASPYVVLVRPSTLIFSVVGGVFGLFIAVAVAGMWAYIRHTRRRHKQ